MTPDHLSLFHGSDQARECPPIPDINQSLLGELRGLGEPPAYSISENLRIELDQSELRQRELLVRVQELDREAAELRVVVKDLHEQLSVLSASKAAKLNSETGLENRVNHHLGESAIAGLHERLTAAEDKNMELLSKLDEALNEKGQQTASYCDSAWKIQELLEKVKTAEEERLEAKREAEDRARHSERLSQQLKLREEELRHSEEKLAQVTASADDEREEAFARLEELQSVVGRIQGALTLKEKETGNLRAQFQDVQAALDCRERQAEELKKRLQEERDEVVQRCGMSCEELENQMLDLRRTLKNKEKELAASSEHVKHLEEQLEKLNVGRETLCSQVDDADTILCNEIENTHDYKTQCSNLMEMNTRLLQTLNKSETSLAELSESRAALLEQLTALKASEKHLTGRIEVANMNVEDREKRLLDENLHLEETAQKAFFQKEESDAQVEKLQQEILKLLDAQSSLKTQLTATQEKLELLTSKSVMLEKSLAVSQRGRAELLEELQEAEEKLRAQTVKRSILQAPTDELESTTGELHREKGAAEGTEKLQKHHDEHQSSSLQNKEAPVRLAIAEAQLELNIGVVARLREEVVELRAQLLAGNEERIKVQTLQEMMEATREELCVLVDQLKAQVEELNRRHVDDILRSREHEEALICERDCEAQARAGLAAELTSCREELDRLKMSYEALCLENNESQEALHRACTETAELGVNVCMLSAEKEEARLRREDLSTRLQELEEEAQRLNTCLKQLQQENSELHSQLCNESLLAVKQKLQAELNEAQQEVETARKTTQEEIQVLQLEHSSQATSHKTQLQVRHATNVLAIIWVHVFNALFFLVMLYLI